MRVLAVFSIKGGVGKTATAVNLAYLASRAWSRVLLWDLDPQAAATFYFRVRPRVKGGIEAILRRERPLDRWVKGTDFERLDLLPADTSYRNADLVLSELKKPVKGLRRVLRSLGDDAGYQWVFLDCPPSISLLSESVFRAVDALLVPVIPTTLSLRTLQQLDRVCGELPYPAPPILPFFAMVDRRKRLHRTIVEELPQSRPGVLRTEIPYASVVEQMGTRRSPLGAYAPSSPAWRAYEDLWREVRERLDAPPPG